MAARSATIFLHNNTGVGFIAESSNLAHGIWSAPRQYGAGAQNGPGSLVEWGSVRIYCESQGIATGVEGTAIFAASDHTFKTESETRMTGKIKVYWSNPFSGSNTLTVDVPAGLKATWAAFRAMT